MSNSEIAAPRYTSFQDIPQFTSWGHYYVDVEWMRIELHLEQFAQSLNVDLDPDFQRAHVWTREQQIAYVEFVLQGGATGRDILWNCSTWHSPAKGSDRDTIVLVDGKQRLQAVREFMANRLPAFGSLYREFGGVLRPSVARFVWRINDLATRQQVLEWYLSLNAGGTVHAPAEIARVRAMLAAEQQKLSNAP